MQGGRGIHCRADRGHDFMFGIAAQLEGTDFSAALDQGQDRALVAIAARAGMLATLGPSFLPV